jgi:hypothetical protein
VAGRHRWLAALESESGLLVVSERDAREKRAVDTRPVKTPESPRRLRPTLTSPCCPNWKYAKGFRLDPVTRRMVCDRCFSGDAA